MKSVFRIPRWWWFWDGEKLLIHPDRSDRSDTVDPWFFLKLSKFFMKIHKQRKLPFHPFCPDLSLVTSQVSLKKCDISWYDTNAGIHHFIRVTRLAIVFSTIWLHVLYHLTHIWSNLKVSPICGSVEVAEVLDAINTKFLAWMSTKPIRWTVTDDHTTGSLV